MITNKKLSVHSNIYERLMGVLGHMAKTRLDEADESEKQKLFQQMIRNRYQVTVNDGIQKLIEVYEEKYKIRP